MIVLSLYTLGDYRDVGKEKPMNWGMMILHVLTKSSIKLIAEQKPIMWISWAVGGLIMMHLP